MAKNPIGVPLVLGSKMKTFERYSLKDKYINKEYAESVRDDINQILKSELESLGLPVQMVDSTGFYDQKSIKSIDLLKHLKSSPLQTLRLFKFTNDSGELIFRASLFYFRKRVKLVVETQGSSRIDLLAKKVINPVNELIDAYFDGSLDLRLDKFSSKVRSLNTFFDSASRLDKKVKNSLSEASLIFEAFEWESDKHSSIEYLSLDLDVESLYDCFIESAASIGTKL